MAKVASKPLCQLSLLKSVQMNLELTHNSSIPSTAKTSSSFFNAVEKRREEPGLHFHSMAKSVSDGHKKCQGFAHVLVETKVCFLLQLFGCCFAELWKVVALNYKADHCKNL